MQWIDSATVRMYIYAHEGQIAMQTMRGLMNTKFIHTYIITPFIQQCNYIVMQMTLAVNLHQTRSTPRQAIAQGQLQKQQRILCDINIDTISNAAGDKCSIR